MPEWIRTWEGGRVAVDRRGREVWHVVRMHRGERYSIRLLVSSEREARAELALFERDPEGYWRAHQERQSPTGYRIDADTIKRLTTALSAAGGTPGHVKDVRRYLLAWANALEGVPIRTVRHTELVDLLDGWKTARRHRIAALQAFCTHAVKIGRLAPADNPAALLKYDPEAPEKNRRSKIHSPEEVAALYAKIPSQEVRDVICLRAKTGMHHTEISRLASGAGQLREVDGGEIAGVITFTHKSRYQHSQSLDAQAFAAARRLVAARRAPDKTWVRTLSGINPSELRHSFVSWSTSIGRIVTATGRGVPLEQVSRIVGHRSPRMTGDRYDHSIPPMIVIDGLALQHEKDPRPYEPEQYADPNP